MAGNQFNPIDSRRPSISAGQLTRVGQLATQSALSSGTDMISGSGGTNSRRGFTGHAAGWWKVQTNATSGAYTLRPQIWKPSTAAWVDLSGSDDVDGLEINGYDVIPTSQYMPKFYAAAVDMLDGEVAVLFNWLSIQPCFWAGVQEPTAVAGSVNRWTYDWAEYRKSGAGHKTWSVMTGGRSGENTAYNAIENMNTGANAHVEGNGIDPANLSSSIATFAMMPATQSASTNINMVVMHPVKRSDTGAWEHWFQYENGVDGDCV